MFRPAVLLLVVCHINALKLLTNDDGNEDWEWEADIQFSFKPFSGICQDGSGNIDKTASSDAGYGKSNDLSELVCDEAVAGKKDFDAYCVGTLTLSDKKFHTIVAEWKKALAKAKEFKKCPHYYAKLATLSNQEMVKEKKTSNLVKSFDVKMDDGAYNFYKEAATKGKATADTFCYSEAGVMWAKNDPKVKNMDGEEFEIMATGTFALVSFKKLTTQTIALEVLSTIDRAGTRCGATYIQNITLQGQWVEDIGVPQIQVRAEASVPKGSALQVSFDGSWKSAAQQWSYSVVKEATNRKFVLNLHDIEIFVSIDSHRIHEAGVQTKRFANFLNVNLNGVSKLAGFSVGGLLGRDSHTEAAQIPEGCESSALLVQAAPQGLSQITIEA